MSRMALVRARTALWVKRRAGTMLHAVVTSELCAPGSSIAAVSPLRLIMIIMLLTDPGVLVWKVKLFNKTQSAKGSWCLFFLVD